MTERLLTGEPGSEVWRSGAISVHVLDPAADVDVLHAWVTGPNAAFFGLGALTRDELRETYEFVASLPTHHAYLVRDAGEPVAMVQLYHPEDDPVAAAYDVEPGDVGAHFFLGSRRSGWPALGPALLAFGFALPAVRRIVVEPDVRHRAAIARMVAMGFEPAGKIHFESPHGPKDAMLAFLTRERALALSRGRPTSRGVGNSTAR
ncbi:GNAT family N-acetyltransferase [Isoptericola chiayiensis]|uniref:Lysine N-acyltransferase MbtK n=1 Tax=Isoptericola chiayiensis TaxID=579446 RepID=A0ABP8YPX8_9MICO|nr:GNAT family N-acetyltransferase [Isoptericola chiayiensis]NOW01795.1 penicillin amidase [Isoptericola chiayiensis]